MHVQETVEELRMLLEYSDELRQRFGLRYPRDLPLDAGLLNQRWNDAIDRLLVYGAMRSKSSHRGHETTGTELALSSVNIDLQSIDELESIA